jgi:hypothetical protein
MVAELLPRLDWPQALALAEEHGVVAQIATRLCHLSGNGIPEQARQRLQELHRAQLFATLRITGELFRVLERFAAKEIECLVVKGPALAMQAYGDAGMRPYGDVDMLVRQCDMRRATEVMAGDGYQADVSLAAIEAGKIPGQYLFSRPDTKMIVELHNERTMRYFPKPLPLEKLFERQIRVCIDAHEVPALCAEDELVLICIHGAKHLWERLMWIADVAALISRQSSLKWNRAIAAARAVGAERMLHTGLQLAIRLLKAPVPENVAVAVRTDGVAGRLAEQSIQWLPDAHGTTLGLLDRAFFRMRMRGGWVGGPVYLMRLSLSPTEEDWMRGSPGRSSALLETMRRPFRLAKKYGPDDTRR